MIVSFREYFYKISLEYGEQQILADYLNNYVLSNGWYYPVSYINNTKDYILQGETIEGFICNVTSEAEAMYKANNLYYNIYGELATTTKDIVNSYDASIVDEKELFLGKITTIPKPKDVIKVNNQTSIILGTEFDISFNNEYLALLTHFKEAVDD